MPLILAPSYDDQTRAQIEDYLSIIRMRRMSAAVEYQIGISAKIQNETDKLQKRIQAAYATLQKRVEVCAKAETALADQLAKCEMLRGELSLVLALNPSDV